MLRIRQLRLPGSTGMSVARRTTGHAVHSNVLVSGEDLWCLAAAVEPPENGGATCAERAGSALHVSWSSSGNSTTVTPRWAKASRVRCMRGARACEGDRRSRRTRRRRALVECLVQAGIVVRDPLVTDVLRGHRPAVSPRTVERRFRAATGLTRGAIRQIERARTAAGLLAAGVPTASVVAQLGYFDEPHLARALRSYVGGTAKQLRERAGGAIALDLDQRLTS